MGFQIIGEGFVCEQQPGTSTAVATESRCALTEEGDLVCCYVVTSKVGVNDFRPVISRSTDAGVTWQEKGLIWPDLADAYSIEGAISGAPNGELFFFGTHTPIDESGEPNWCDETQGLKPNELIWAKSADGGRTWTNPTVIPMPIPGAAEAPGPLWVTRGGRWLGCYAPYNTFDPGIVVERHQVVVMRSDDEGETWRHSSMLRFENVNSGAAEAWVVELADGRLLGTCWHLNNEDGTNYPNAYALSTDGGESWSPTRSTGIKGQSTALTPLPDGRALFVYNQREHGEPGVYVALVDPTETDFGVEANEIVWRAESGTQRGSSAALSDFKDFSFGEPAVTLVPDGTFLLVLWTIEPDIRGIRYVKFKTGE